MFLGLVCNAYQNGQTSEANPFFSLGILIAAIVMTAAASRVASRFTARLIENPSLSGIAGQAVTNRVNLLFRIFVVAMFIGVMLIGDWPFALLAAAGMGPDWPLAQNFVGILPYPILLIAAWIPLYRLHQITAPGTWTLGGYLLHRVRYTLFVFGIWIPMTILSVMSSGADRQAWLFALGNTRLGLYTCMGIIAWCFPLFLRFFWGCTALPDGPLRNRIIALQDRTRVTFSGIYIWNFGGSSLLNAAAVGFFPPFRYLFLSRALIASLTPDQLDAVVCHEAGHVRHRHLVFYVIITLAVMTMIEIFMVPALGLLPLAGSGFSEILLVLILMAAYFRLCFGFISRRMERQADLYALEVMGRAGPMIRALERLAILSGNIRMAASWHHMSIAERVYFLRQAEKHPELAAAHNNMVGRIKKSGFVLAAAVLAGILLLGEPETTPPSHTEHHAAPTLASHWRNLARLIPDESSTWLRLAQSLLRENPSNRTEALQYAKKAMTLAKTAEERHAAARLIADIADERKRPSGKRYGN